MVIHGKSLLNEAEGYHFDPNSLQDSPVRGPTLKTTSDEIKPPCQSSTSSESFQKHYITWLWIALGLALLTLGVLTGFQVYSSLQKAEADRQSTQTSSIFAIDKNDTVTRMIKNKEQLNMLNRTIVGLETEQVKAASRLEARQARVFEDESLHLCTELLTAVEESIGGSHAHTEYVIGYQTGWQLDGCPATAQVLQARLGSFTSSADGPCAKRGSPVTWRLESCPSSLDITTEVQRAIKQSKGEPLLDTPMQLLRSGALRTDPCPLSYKQLQIVYLCPQQSETTREQRCKTIAKQQASRPADAVTAPEA